MPTKALSTGGTIDFSTVGIGDVIKGHRLRVPPHQREYSWTDKQVTELFQDIGGAISGGKPAYFLGTIVLTGGPDAEIKEVADGQQRLATTVILLAAIRDFFQKRGEKNRTRYIEDKFLFTIDLTSGEQESRLSLNVDDNDFFRRAILPPPDSPDRKTPPKKNSHELLANAAAKAADHVHKVTQPLPESAQVDHLNQWVRFLEQSALVNALVVPDDLNAFVMFETLNDRGLKTSQADLLKNYLFGQASDRVGEATQMWSTMLGALETLGLDDVAMLYLRHLCSALYGATRERDVFETIKNRVSGKSNSITFLNTLASYAEDYVAILNPAHPKWNAYDASVRRSIATLQLLNAEQIRPLLLACAHHLTPAEVAIAFRLFVAWIVRFLIVGGSRGGTLDAAYARVAVEVCGGKATTAKKIQEEMKALVPTDAQFQSEFTTARVSKAILARYYLRALEQCERNESEPEFLPNEDQASINLEHVLPENPGVLWPHIRPEIAAAYYKRLGNLVLLKARANSKIGNLPFASKKAELSKSTYKLTEMAGKADDWTPEEIEQRQKKLAGLAVKTWPLLK